MEFMLAANSAALLSASKHLSQRPPLSARAAYLQPVVWHLTGFASGRVMEDAVALAFGASCLVEICLEGIC